MIAEAAPVSPRAPRALSARRLAHAQLCRHEEGGRGGRTRREDEEGGRGGRTRRKHEEGDLTAVTQDNRKAPWPSKMAVSMRSRMMAFEE